MSINFEKAFGVHQHTLLLRGQRAEVLASNIVNSDTPGFKARDYDFDSVLKMVGSDSRGMKTTQQGHIQAGAAGGAPGDLLYRVPLHASLDGNTVDAQTEQVEFGRNAFEYQASLRFLNGKIKGLMTAIRGD